MSLLAPRSCIIPSPECEVGCSSVEATSVFVGEERVVGRMEGRRGRVVERAENVLKKC